MRKNSIFLPESRTTNRLIDIGLFLATVPVPVPQVKVLGVISIAAGLGLEIYDEIHRRKADI
ncbi:MAG: hypothetical protein OXI87_04990 [Albidovulum sp.]|nr:hypothetical protein [Albidovulum sp.]